MQKNSIDILSSSRATGTDVKMTRRISLQRPTNEQFPSSTSTVMSFVGPLNSGTCRMAKRERVFSCSFSLNPDVPQSPIFHLPSHMPGKANVPHYIPRQPHSSVQFSTLQRNALVSTLISKGKSCTSHRTTTRSSVVEESHRESYMKAWTRIER